MNPDDTDQDEPTTGVHARDPVASFGTLWKPGDPLPRGSAVDDIVTSIPNRTVDWDGFASDALDE